MHGVYPLLIAASAAARSFDFIVVGGGSSGSVLAGLLATKGPTLLIERGANHSAYPQSSVRQGWPQIAALLLRGVRHDSSGHWSGTASVLGGGSALNGAVCWRGELALFQALGFSEVAAREAFEWLEREVCGPATESEFVRAFADSWAEIGLGSAGGAGLASWADEAAGGGVAFAKTIFSAADGTRRPLDSTFESSAGRSNLTVMLHTTATRVVFEAEPGRQPVARGVEIQSGIGNGTVSVRRGGTVYLNAGALEAPKLLMLSGIGPASHLAAHGVPLVVDSPDVGRNLIDRKDVPMVVPVVGQVREATHILHSHTRYTQKTLYSEGPILPHTHGHRCPATTRPCSRSPPYSHRTLHRSLTSARGRGARRRPWGAPRPHRRTDRRIVATRCCRRC